MFTLLAIDCILTLSSHCKRLTAADMQIAAMGGAPSLSLPNLSFSLPKLVLLPSFEICSHSSFAPLSAVPSFSLFRSLPLTLFEKLATHSLRKTCPSLFGKLAVCKLTARCYLALSLPQVNTASSLMRKPLRLPYSRKRTTVRSPTSSHRTEFRHSLAIHEADPLKH